MKSFLVMCLTLFSPLASAWEYAEGHKADNDIFGVSNFDVKWSGGGNKLKLVLTAKPFIDIVAGSGKSVPYLSIKIREAKSKKTVLKRRKKLCEYVDTCPMPAGQKEKIVVPIKKFDLKEDKKYTAEVLVIKNCGAHLTAVKEDFMVKSNHNDDHEDDDDPNGDK